MEKKTLTIDPNVLKEPSTWTAIVVLVTAIAIVFTGEPPPPELTLGEHVIVEGEGSSANPYILGGAVLYFLMNTFWKRDTQSNGK